MRHSFSCTECLNIIVLFLDFFSVGKQMELDFHFPWVFQCYPGTVQTEMKLLFHVVPFPTSPLLKTNTLSDLSNDLLALIAGRGWNGRVWWRAVQEVVGLLITRCYQALAAGGLWVGSSCSISSSMWISERVGMFALNVHFIVSPIGYQGHSLSRVNVLPLARRCNLL
jgi:hypothetical protein